MRILAILFLLCSCYEFTSAQSDSSLLLKEVELKLSDLKTNVSTILADPSYVPLHTQKEFRSLIKQRASAAPLSIVPNNEPGDKIKVSGIVKNDKGKPIAGVLIYIYQTDARGWYTADAPQLPGLEGNAKAARLFGYVKTDKKGYFELYTIKPAGYPDSDKPSHIHIHLASEGYGSYVTELLFDDDKRLTPEIRANMKSGRFHIANAGKATYPFQHEYIYNLTLLED